ncbi:hypothetical protein JCM15765_02490 [Paradesulfitobacterium aromaticivorans]
MARRKHSKVVTELPKELVEAVNKRLVEGTTYQEITDWLNETGQQISRSSVGRYGKDFLSKLERLKVVKDQAKAIVEADPDAPATEMHEAANQLAVQLIMETLMNVPDLKGAKITELMQVLARLERSAVAREKLKYEFNKGVDAALGKLKEQLKAELAGHPEVLEQIYHVVDQVAEQTKA